MISKEIDSLIGEAMKKKDSIRLETLRLIKNTLVKAEKDGIKLDEITEIKILSKMVKQSEDAISQFKSGNRDDLATQEEAQLNIIKEFVPKEASEEDIINKTREVCFALEQSGATISMACMKQIMSAVQTVYPNASGKVISKVVNSWNK